MYERLDKLREEVKRRKKMIEVAKMRLKEAEEKLREAENSQILSDVGELNLSPEELAEFLKLVKNGHMGVGGDAPASNLEEADEFTDDEEKADEY